MKFILPPLIIFLVVQMAQAQKMDPDDIALERKYQRTFDFIFKLDSLGLTKGKLNYLNESIYNNDDKHTNVEELNAVFSKQNDSVYSVIINRQKFTLNTVSGWVTDLESQNSFYRNIYFRIAESNQSDIHGKDSLGNWTASFGGFQKTIATSIVYEPKRIDPTTTVQYKIRHSPFAGDNDATVIESDTTKITVYYNPEGKPFREINETYGLKPDPEFLEYEYSYVGDTTIRTLKRFISRPREEAVGDGIIVGKIPFLKSVTISNPERIHTYSFSNQNNSTDCVTRDFYWKTAPNGRIYIIEERYEGNVLFSNGYVSRSDNHYKQVYTYTAE